MTSQYKQIGNTVPVNLAQAIASNVTRFLDGLPTELFSEKTDLREQPLQLELPLKMTAWPSEKARLLLALFQLMLGQCLPHPDQVPLPAPCCLDGSSTGRYGGMCQALSAHDAQ